MSTVPAGADTAPAEVELFNRINRLATPLVRAGFGSPWALQPTGLILLEVAGRNTGIVRQTPLVGMLLPGAVLTSTVRGNSQWLRNLAAADTARVWLWGVPMTVRPAVFAAGAPADERAPALLRDVLAGAARQSGLNIALLSLAPCARSSGSAAGVVSDRQFPGHRGTGRVPPPAG